MLQLDPEQAIRLWAQSNIESDHLGALNPSNYLLIRYEDFASNPHVALAKVLELVNGRHATDSLPIEGRKTLRLETTHTISGNPGRIRAGNRLEIREDEEWKTAIPAALESIVTERTAELLHHYGYAVPGF